MITLKTLPTATAQEVFNQAKNHLLKQGGKSIVHVGFDGTKCAYRSHLGNGISCAAGCFISDEEYDPKMEFQTWDQLVNKMIAPPNHKDLIMSLQIVHDEKPAQDWPTALNDVATRYNLKP